MSQDDLSSYDPMRPNRQMHFDPDKKSNCFTRGLNHSVGIIVMLGGYKVLQVYTIFNLKVRAGAEGLDTEPNRLSAPTMTSPFWVDRYSG